PLLVVEPAVRDRRREQPVHQARRCLSRWPTATIASTAGSSSRPKSVSAYSTDGGVVGRTVRVTIPSSASRFSRAESTLPETPSMSPRSSLKRRGDSRRYQTMFGVQAPPSSAMHSVSGHSAGGGATRLGRCLSDVDGTYRRLPRGNWQLVAC